MLTPYLSFAPSLACFLALNSISYNSEPENKTCAQRESLPIHSASLLF
jgi:hypothetical protein